MNEFMQWYWDWGIAVSGVIIFFLGFAYGAVWYKDRCERRLRKEAVRLAITNTAQEYDVIHGLTESADSHLQSDSG